MWSRSRCQQRLLARLILFADVTQAKLPDRYYWTGGRSERPASARFGQLQLEIGKHGTCQSPQMVLPCAYTAFRCKTLVAAWSFDFQLLCPCQFVFFSCVLMHFVLFASFSFCRLSLTLQSFPELVEVVPPSCYIFLNVASMLGFTVPKLSQDRNQDVESHNISM